MRQNHVYPIKAVQCTWWPIDLGKLSMDNQREAIPDTTDLADTAYLVCLTRIKKDYHWISKQEHYILQLG